MLKKEFEYYIAHQDELVKNHFGRFIIIQNEKVEGDFVSDIEAIKYAKNALHLPLGTFLVQQCMPGKENYTQFFHSHFIFT